MANRAVNMVAIVIAAASLVVSLLLRVEGAPGSSPPQPAATSAAAAPAAAPTVGSPPAAAPTAIPEHVVEPARPLDVPNVVRDPSDVPPPITRTQPTTVKITLTIKELVSELTDGTTYTFWTFDGTVPGPMLRVMQGDTVELTLVNPATNLSAHNIDLHAVNGPGGGAAVTNVQPGESKTFTFTPLNAGVFVYHCAFPPPWHHIAQGMYGAILVEPPGGLPPVDREFYVVQGEWYTSEPFGTAGHMEFDEAKAYAEAPEYYTFNGNVNALTKIHPLEANVGEKIRLYFGVGGPNIGSNFHIIGEIFDKVFSGSPETYIANEETWYVPPGSVSAFEFVVNEPGAYVLVDHALFRAAHGALGQLIVAGDHDDSIYSPAPASGQSH
jgi:nitrite reductase (NO-forming)